MEDGKTSKNKKTTGNVSKSSSVKKSKTSKVVNLSNEELLDQILSKKKKKNNNSNVEKKEVSVNKKVSKKSSTVKKTKQFNELENDFIYDQIKSQKKQKKEKAVKKVEIKEKAKKDKIEIVDKEVLPKKDKIGIVDKEVLPNKEDFKSDSINSLEESVKRKKEKKDDFEEFITEIENADLLRQIKEALAKDKVEYVRPGYEYSNKDALEKIDNEINERLKTQTFNIPIKKRSKIFFTIDKKTVTILGLVLVFISLVAVGLVASNLLKSNISYSGNFEEKEINQSKVVEDNSKKEYEECLDRDIDENDVSTEITDYTNNLSEHLKKYHVSVVYEDVNIGFKYVYNEDKDYYAASTIKLLGAMYIYEKAYNNEIDLNYTLKYSSKDRRGSSSGMENHDYGEMISLRQLVKYSVVLSDNTAHNMIVKYIGVSKLREYGLSLGAKLTHTSNDLFGYIDGIDANIYLNKVYSVINSIGELGDELKGYLLSAEQNSLNLEEKGIVAGHKYGEYKSLYHDIGIVYAENPYLIAVLTEEGRDDYDAIIREINSKVYELHKMYYDNRVNYCNSLVYGK